MMSAESDWTQLETAFRASVKMQLSAHMIDYLCEQLRPVYLRLWRPPLTDSVTLPADPAAAADARSALEAASLLAQEQFLAAFMEIVRLQGEVYRERWQKVLPEPPQTMQ